MDVLSLGVESEPQLQACVTVTATWDLSCICDLHCSLWKCWVLNPLSGARVWTLILTETTLGQVLNLLDHNENSRFCYWMCCCTTVLKQCDYCIKYKWYSWNNFKNFKTFSFWEENYMGFIWQVKGCMSQKSEERTPALSPSWRSIIYIYNTSSSLKHSIYICIYIYYSLNPHCHTWSGY